MKKILLMALVCLMINPGTPKREPLPAASDRKKEEPNGQYQIDTQ
jgi:hypothetical protein